MKTSKLSDLCKLVTDGTHDTPKIIEKGIPLIKAKEISGGKIDFEKCDHISYKEHLKVISRSKPEKGDILFVHIGASLGESAYIKTEREFSIKNVALFKPDTSKIDRRYLFYYIVSPNFQQKIKSIKTGSAQPFISLTFLRNHVIEYSSDIQTQKKIAAILSAYDDLIENNNRRIKILEEMAQALYREWFVEFRFPGHEDVKMVEVDGKVVPEGWEVKSIGDVIQTIGGGTPSRKNSEYWENGTVTWFTPSDLTASKSLFITNSQSQITEIGLKKSSAKLFPPYSVMMTSRATIGVVSINSETACTNQGFIVCIPNERLSAYQIYFWIKSNLETIQSVASGATYKEINKSVFRAMNILVAPKMINKLFFETIHSFFKQIECLQAKNLILIQTRDLLLPRLIEGEIEV